MPPSAPTTAEPSAPVIEQVALDELHADPANPRRISDDELESLTRSLRQFGFVQPVLARREDGVVIGGHQRLVAARRLGWETVPVTWLDISVEQARLLGLALNKISGSWDDQLLARLLADLQASSELDLSLAGFGDDEVKELLLSLAAKERADRIESFDYEAALEQAAKEPRSKLGELWILGGHRLLCGDATSPVDVERLLGGEEPCLLSTDPPYGVSLDPTWRDGIYNGLGAAEAPYMRIDGQMDEENVTRANGSARGRSKGHRNTTISGDTRVDWSEAYALVPSLNVGYVWHAGVHAAEVAQGLTGIGFEIVSQIIWDKGLFAMGRSWYPGRSGAKGPRSPSMASATRRRSGGCPARR